jgi:molybdopterin-containing oxidoreductase family iron-sulfur binding subunit
MSREDQMELRSPVDRAAAGAGGKRSSSLAILNETPAAPPARQWRSIEAREGDLELARAAQAEFPAGASVLEGVHRRGFMQLLGGSLAVAGTACYRPNQPIVPYVRRPPEVTPGNPLHFATASVFEGRGFGLVVESHEGRPTKVEGNPDHPDSRGAATSVHQAMILDLYDEHRARELRHRGQPVAWRTLQAEILQLVEKHAADGGARLRFLVEPNGSPLLADLRGRISSRLPKARFVSFTATGADGEVEGARLAFGRPLDVRYDLDRAAVIVSLDADFLGDGPDQVRLQRQFAARRTPGAQMNRLYVAEPGLTITGGMADHRLRVRGSEVVAVAQALVAELAKQQGGEALGALAGLPRVGGEVNARWVTAVAADLARTRGNCVVIAGRRQPAAVHALAHAINSALGNLGTTVTAWAPAGAEGGGIETLRSLVEEIAAGQVDTLVITAENPVFAAPQDFKLAKLLERVPTSIYLGRYVDETAAAVSTFVPVAHSLESWGDVRGSDGTVSLVQPLIAPLWTGITEADLLAAFLGEGDRGTYQLLRTFWQGRTGAAADAFEAQWETWLARGVVENTTAQPEAGLSVNAGGLAGALGQALQAATPAGQGLEVAFVIDPKVLDGRHAHNAWLQELPHPITKITWDNAVVMSQTTAQQLGLVTADIVRVEIGDRQVTGPVYVQPGHADETVSLALGYGRTAGSPVGRDVGFNAGLLRSSRSPWFERGASVIKVGSHYRFGITQDHWSMESRQPAIHGPVADLQKKDSDLWKVIDHNRGELPNIQGQEAVPYDKQPYKWAMAIDLSKCSGCNACVTACQAENNIPVVGRENVRIGREMFWLRIDRYYEGDIADPTVVTQPVACVHCETAPCEYVCPVNATVHSDEGLNEMVYNRCIGTRYCSNNCPYKVRRFNFLDFQGEPSPTVKMGRNPDVTVRSRGVMEKCTYCVQRIERARIDTRIEGRAIRDGELQTACQQTCPAGAIVFGSLNDTTSAVTRLHHDQRRYDLLHELNTRPRTAYLARVRNPNPELA